VPCQPFLQYRPDCSVADMFPNAPALRRRSGQVLEKTRENLLAQSIAYSRFIEFDATNRRFAANYADSLVSLNLMAIAPTLIESELFGHGKDAWEAS
jgi:hypothetical protein